MTYVPPGPAINDQTNGGADFFGYDSSLQFSILNQPGAVNNWSAVGGQSGVAPTFLIQGTDTNVSGNFAAQGTGGFVFGNGSGRLLSIPDSAGFVYSYPSIQASSVFAGAVILTAVGVVGSNIPIALVPIGSAGVAMGPGHIVSNTGAYAAGRFCSALGFGAGAMGNTSRAAGAYSFVTGNSGNDNAVTGKRVHASGFLGTNTGTTQISEHSLLCATTGTTSAVATASGNTNNSFNGLQFSAGHTTTCRVTVSARDTSSGARAGWFITAMFNRDTNPASTTLDGSTGTGTPAFATGTGASTWMVTVSADTTNGSGAITCTGSSGSSIRWSVRVDSSEAING